MQSEFRPFRALSTLTLIFVLSFTAFADTIRLKDGSIVKGRIVSFGGGKFVVSIGSGTRRKEMSFTAGEIESIQFDQNLGAQVASAPTSQPVSRASYNPQRTAEPKRSTQTPEVDETDQPATQPVRTATVPPAVRNDTAVPARTAPSNVKPIEIAVNVSADNTSNGWTNSGWVVKKGQKLRITGDGEISLGGGKTTGPSGSYELEDGSKLLKSVPTGALIAVIGDDNNDFIYIGSNREFTATRDGALFLGVNEGNLNDNSGKFTVKVEIDPISGG
jgi:hypothetical protein